MSGSFRLVGFIGALPGCGPFHSSSLGSSPWGSSGSFLSNADLSARLLASSLVTTTLSDTPNFCMSRCLYIITSLVVC